MSKDKGSEVPAANSFANPRRTGWLYKHGGTGFTSHWRKRWFVADNHYLFYYKDSNDKKPVGLLCLPDYQSCHSVDSKEYKKPYTFMLDKGNSSDSDGPKNYMLHADSEKDMEEWIKAITEEIKFMPGQSLANGYPGRRRKGEEVDQKAFDELTKAASAGPKLIHPTAQRPRMRGRRPPRKYATFHEDDSKEETPPTSPSEQRKAEAEASSPSASPSTVKRGHHPTIPLKPKPRSTTSLKVAAEQEKPPEPTEAVTVNENKMSPSTKRAFKPPPPKKPAKEREGEPVAIPEQSNRSESAPAPVPKPRPIPPKKPSIMEMPSVPMDVEQETGTGNVPKMVPSTTRPVLPRKPRPQPPAKPRASTAPETTELPTTPVATQPRPIPTPKPMPVPRKRTRTDLREPTSPPSAKEPPKELPKVPSKEPPKELPKVPSKEPPKELPKVPSKELPKELSEEPPEVPPKELPKELPKEPPKELPKEPPKEFPKELPKELSEEPPEVPPKEPPKGFPQEPPKELPKEPPKEPPKELPKEPPKEFPQEPPKELPKETQENVPMAKPDERLATIEKAPEVKQKEPTPEAPEEEESQPYEIMGLGETDEDESGVYEFVEVMPLPDEGGKRTPKEEHGKNDTIEAREKEPPKREQSPLPPLSPLPSSLARAEKELPPLPPMQEADYDEVPEELIEEAEKKTSKSQGGSEVISPGYKHMNPSSLTNLGRGSSLEEYETMQRGVTIESKLPLTPEEDKLHEYEEPFEWQHSPTEEQPPALMPYNPYDASPGRPGSAVGLPVRPGSELYDVPPAPRPASENSLYDIPRAARRSPEVPPEGVRTETRFPSGSTASRRSDTHRKEPSLPDTSDTVVLAAVSADAMHKDLHESVSEEIQSRSSSSTSSNSTGNKTKKKLERDALGYTKIYKKMESADKLFGFGSESDETTEWVMVEGESSLDIPATLKQAREILRLAKVVKAEAEQTKKEAHRELELARRERHDAELLKRNAGEILRMAKERLQSASAHARH